MFKLIGHLFILASIVVTCLRGIRSDWSITVLAGGLLINWLAAEHRLRVLTRKDRERESQTSP